MGMTLEQHLETHPKDQVIKALVAAVGIGDLSAPSMAPSNSIQQQPSAGIVYGNIRTPSRPPTNLLIVNSTSTKFYSNTPNPNSQSFIGAAVPAAITQQSALPQTTSFLPLIQHRIKHEIEPPRYTGEIQNKNQQDLTEWESEECYEEEQEEGQEEQKEELLEGQEEFEEEDEHEQQQEPEEDENNYEEEPEEECMEVGYENETLNSEKGCGADQIEAQYYEQENGSFVVEEVPQALVKYTENANGEMEMTEKIVRTPPCVIRFKDDENASLQNGDDVKKPCVKVLSDVTLTADMISKGIEDIIISRNVKCENNISFENPIKIEYPTRPKSVIQPPLLSPKLPHKAPAELICSKVNSPDTSPPVASSSSSTLSPLPSPSSSVIKMIPNEYFLQSSPTVKVAAPVTAPVLRPQTKAFMNRPPKKLIVKLKKPLFEETKVEKTDDEEEHCESPVKVEVMDVDEEKPPEILCSEVVVESDCSVPIPKLPEEAQPSTSAITIEHVSICDLTSPAEDEEEDDEANSEDEEEDEDVHENEYSAVSRSPQPSSSSKDYHTPPKKRIKLRKKRRTKMLIQKSSMRMEFLRQRNVARRKLLAKIMSEKLHMARADSPIIGKTSSHCDSDSEEEEKYSPKAEDLQMLETSGEETNVVDSLALPIVKQEIKVESSSWTSQIVCAFETVPTFETNNLSHHARTAPPSPISSHLSPRASHYPTSHADLVPDQAHSSDDVWTTTAMPSTSIKLEASTSRSAYNDITTSHSNNAVSTTEFHHDLNEAGPSGIDDYRHVQNFFYESDFIFPTSEKAVEVTTPSVEMSSHDDVLTANASRKFIEFNEDGHTGGGWRSAFSPHYNNFEGERNSYVDLDACKTNSMAAAAAAVSLAVATTSSSSTIGSSSSCIRAPSTEMLNIRTDEKMPARGEISEQESNGEIDVSWNNNQNYNYYNHDSYPKYSSTYDYSISKEEWKPNAEIILSFSTQNIQQTNAPSDDTEIKPILDTPEETLQEIKTPYSKYKGPKSYTCVVCNEEFLKLKFRKAHYEVVHPNFKPAKLHSSKHKRFKSSTVTSASMSMSGNAVLEPKIEPLLDISAEILKTETDEAGPSRIYKTLKPLIESEAAFVIGGAELKNHLLNTVRNNHIRRRKIYSCDTCGEEFRNIKTFDHHLANVHPIECQECGRPFRRWANILIHLKRHLGIKNHVCRCGKKFVTKQKLDEHMRTHTGTAPISCADCPRKFRRHSNLIQHRNRYHLKVKPNQKDYVCPQCGDVYHTKAKFNWHKEIHEKKPKGCPYCRERFIHQNSLTSHIRLSHPDRFWTYRNLAKKRVTIKCPICHKLLLKSSIKQHITIHSLTNNYRCNICNKGFSTKWNLKQHRWIHACRSTKPFKCKICSSAFVREADYVTHMNIHKSIKPYTCDHCGFQFSRKYNWLRHTREHEAAKKYKCNICNKTFHRSYYLTEHARVHSGERPFTCNICGKTSATKTNHNKHIVIHHARDPLTAEG